MSSKLLEKLLRDGSLYDGPHKPKELKEIFVNLDGGNLRGTEGGTNNPPAVDNVFLNRTELLAGVSLWSTDKPAALAAYGDISNWNVTAVSDMSELFKGKNTFNDDISNWDVSNVTNMTSMFDGATSFNTTNYDLLLIGWSALTLQSNVVFNMNSTTKFSSGAATTARGVLTSLPKSWTITDGGSVNYVFTTKTELQTAVDLWISDNAAAVITYGQINQWNVSAITDMSELFKGKNTFNDDISNWDVSNVTNMTSMFDGATSFNTTNYDLLLIGWSALTLQSNVVFNMNSTTKFSSGAATTARGVLTSLPKSWTITDGGQV